MRAQETEAMKRPSPWTIIDLLAIHADIEDGRRALRFGIISKAIVDMASSYSPAQAEGLAQNNPEAYFRSELFQEDALWAGLSPDWVIEVLEEYGYWTS